MNDENQKTLRAYESGIDAYNAAKIPEVIGSVKERVDASLAMIPNAGRVLEIGSAHGRDADYIESKGFIIDRTDAAESFVEYMRSNGKEARLLDALTDSFGTNYDMIYANAVLLHFAPEQSLKVIQKAYESLNNNGLLAFSVKIGNGSEWSSSKLNAPRYFNYWAENDLREIISKTSFEIVFWEEGSTGHDNSDWYHVNLKKS